MGEEREALEYVRALVRKSGSSFFLGMWSLPRRQREAMFAIYAFGREVDDIADDQGEASEKRVRLNEWRREIDCLFAGAPTRPTTRALWRSMQTFSLKKEEMVALIEGMEMDIDEEMVAPLREDLRLYCRRVAGSIGLLSLAVFGLEDDVGREFALALGQGLQMTNILRDLDEDAEEGRLYLPYEFLMKRGLDPKERSIEELLTAPEIEDVCRELAEEARECFRRVDQTSIRRDKIRGALMMLGLYERILDLLERRGWGWPRKRIVLSPREKMWFGFKRAFL